MIDILDIINDATKEANSFENHAAKNLTLEERLLYLQGLALVMNADGDIRPEEKEYIRILIKSFEMDEAILDSFVEFAQRPDKDTVQAFFRTFRRRSIAQLFLFDALMMIHRDDNVDEKEKLVVDKIAEQLEVLKGTYQDIFDLFCHIINKDWEESALYFSSHLLNPEHFKHLLDYYEIDFDELLAKTKSFRNKRILQIIKSRIKLPEGSEELKLIINNELVLPMIQSSLNRGEVKVVLNKLVFESEEEVELSEVGLGYIQESKTLYLEKSIIISDGNVMAYVSNYLGMNNVEMYAFLFDNDKIIYGEIDKESSRTLKLSSTFEEGKVLAIGDKLFRFIDNGKYNIIGNDEIYSSRSSVDFDEYVNQGMKNVAQTSAWYLMSTGDISLDYALGDQDSKGVLEEVELLSV
ncbi:TPA: TerB family tellurite resistance protein [Vibrio vulnificus]|nr:TerB family tellurite resistance protein [Vibrio vulnificus]